MTGLFGIGPPKAKRRGLCFDLGSKPAGLFGVGGDEIKTQVWDAFAPVWGPVVKFGVTSIFDEVTYAQMLDDLVRRNLCVYMDVDHATANLGWSVDEVPALAYYCCVQVNHGGKLWRRENLAGHSCADAVELDAAANPEGLYAFRCHVTPVGRQKLPNYQALSIHFDPYGEDMAGHPVGQVLICVGAVNGPQIPGALPAGGKFNRSDDMSMKKRKLFALEKGEGGAEDGAAETKDLSPVMAELSKCLGLPDGADPEAVLGAALAVIKAAQPGEPDGDEPLEGDKDGEQLPAEASKYVEEMPPEMRGYARKAALRFARPGRLVQIFAGQLSSKATPKGVLDAFLTHRARSVDGGEFARLKSQVDEMKAAQAAAYAAERKGKIDALFSAAAGRLPEAKLVELRAQADQFNATPEQVAKWLPDETDVIFTTGGAPAGKGKPADADGGNVRGADQATANQTFRQQYEKDTGKKIKYEMAGRIVGGFFAKGVPVDYAKAKAEADRMPPEAFLKGGK